jgi:hypothetical protein
MKRLALSQGLFAVVDDADHEWLSRWKWSAERACRTFYATRKGDGRILRMHREIVGAAPGQQVDHADGDGLNNTRANLRLVSSAQNQNNRTRKQPGATSRYRGVSWDAARNKWQAQINVHGRKVHLGRFDSELEAATAYDQAGLARDPEHFTPNLTPAGVPRFPVFVAVRDYE